MDQKDNSTLKSREAAEFLRMSDSFLRQDRMRRQPRIPFIKIGRAVRYQSIDLRSFLENSRVIGGAK